MVPLEYWASPQGEDFALRVANAGGLLGGGLAGFGSRGKDRWWAIPAGIIGGSMIGCAIDGG